MLSRVENAKYQIMDVPMSGEDIVEILQVQFEDMGVEVSLTDDSSLPVNTASCNGYFYHQDWNSESNIELEVVVRDTNDVIIINNNAWEFLQHEIIQTLEHEIIHREQTIARAGFQPKIHFQSHMENLTEEQKRIVYLSIPDEIDAYANDVALDLLQIYNRTKACERLLNWPTILESESPIFCEYMDLFGPNSDIVKVIVKKTLKRMVS